MTTNKDSVSDSMLFRGQQRFSLRDSVQGRGSLPVSLQALDEPANLQV
jgi:hypothetical protein